MTSSRVLVPVAVAAAVLAVVLGVLAMTRWGDSTTTVSPGSPGSGGGAPGSSGTADPGATQPSAPAQDEPMTRFTSVTRGPDDTTLEVSFWGGVEECYRYTVRAEESAAVVRLTLDERRTHDGPCIELAQQYDRTVPLEQPLGDRRVVDAETGETLLGGTGTAG
jgi:hypothetical protein